MKSKLLIILIISFLSISSASSSYTSSEAQLHQEMFPAPPITQDSSFAPMFAAFIGGLGANMLTSPGTTANKVTNGIVITVLFGLQAVCVAGVLLDNTVYAHTKETLFDADDRALLLNVVINAGCYILGRQAALYDHKQLDEDEIAA